MAIKNPLPRKEPSTDEQVFAEPSPEVIRANISIYEKRKAELESKLVYINERLESWRRLKQ